MAAGREATPADMAATERLMRYWSEGAGAAKIQWEAPDAFKRCQIEVGKYVPPGQVDGLCAHLAHRATGTWPGSKEYLLSHGHDPKGKQ